MTQSNGMSLLGAISTLGSADLLITVNSPATPAKDNYAKICPCPTCNVRLDLAPLADGPHAVGTFLHLEEGYWFHASIYHEKAASFRPASILRDLNGCTSSSTMRELSGAFTHATHLGHDMVIVRRDQQAKNAELREEVHFLRAEVNSSKAEKDASKAEFNALKAEITVSKAEITASKAEITASKAEFNALKAEITASKAEFNALKAEITASKAETEALQNELSIREIVGSAVNGATDHDFELQIKDMEDDIATYQAEIKALVAELHAKEINYTLGNSVIDNVSDNANDADEVYQRQNNSLFETGTPGPWDSKNSNHERQVYRHQNNCLFGEGSPGHIDFENSIGFHLDINPRVCSSEDLNIAPCSDFASASPSMLYDRSPQVNAFTCPDMVFDSSSFFRGGDNNHCFDAPISPKIACDLPPPLSFTPRSPAADAFPPYRPTTPTSDAAIPTMNDGGSASHGPKTLTFEPGLPTMDRGGDTARYTPTTPTLDPAFPALNFEGSPGYGPIFPVLTPKKPSPASDGHTLFPWKFQDEPDDQPILFKKSQRGSRQGTSCSEDWFIVDMPMTEGVNGGEPLAKKYNANTGNGARDGSGGKVGAVGGGYPFTVRRLCG